MFSRCILHPSEQAALAVDFARATAPAGCAAPNRPERPWDERLPEAFEKDLVATKIADMWIFHGILLMIID